MATQEDPRVRGGDDGAGDVTHQALRREANEQIGRVVDGFVADEGTAMDVMCECVNAGCTGRISLAVGEYEAVRRFPTRFLVKQGHEVSANERVVSQSDAYVVVEKTGRAGLYAVGRGSAPAPEQGALEMTGGTEAEVQPREGRTAEPLVERAARAVGARLGTTPEVAHELMQGLARSQSRELHEFAAKVVACGGRLDAGE